MHKAYPEGELPLGERLLRALEAGEEAGGDARGKQSAAVLVVSPDVGPTAWSGRLIDLRVEDHPDPVPELKRLLRFRRGYDWADKGDAHLAGNETAKALEAYQKALDLVPEVDELKYWVAITLLSSEERERGRSMLREVFGKDKAWLQLTREIVKSGTIPIDPSSIDGLLE
jgi:uncharacterized Ntn-hydrolase superfamily protein